MSHVNTVIQIDDLRIRRELGSRYKRGACEHVHLVIDDIGETVECDDCKKQVTPYWAFTMLVQRFERAMGNIESREAEVAAAKAENIHLLAARKVEAVWRSRTMVPACPHCRAGILPEDNLGGSQINRAIELRRREVAR